MSVFGSFSFLERTGIPFGPVDAAFTFYKEGDTVHASPPPVLNNGKKFCKSITDAATPHTVRFLDIPKEHLCFECTLDPGFVLRKSTAYFKEAVRLGGLQKRSEKGRTPLERIQTLTHLPKELDAFDESDFPELKAHAREMKSQVFELLRLAHQDRTDASAQNLILKRAAWRLAGTATARPRNSYTSSRLYFPPAMRETVRAYQSDYLLNQVHGIWPDWAETFDSVEKLQEKAWSFYLANNTPDSAKLLVEVLPDSWDKLDQKLPLREALRQLAAESAKVSSDEVIQYWLDQSEKLLRENTDTVLFYVHKWNIKEVATHYSYLEPFPFYQTEHTPGTLFRVPRLIARFVAEQLDVRDGDPFAVNAKGYTHLIGRDACYLGPVVPSDTEEVWQTCLRLSADVPLSSESLHDFLATARALAD